METIYRYMRQQGWVRARHGRMLAGVCKGISVKTGVDLTLVRLLFFIATIIPGLHSVAYFVAWFLMPEE